MNILFVSSNSSYTKGSFGGAEFSMQLLAENLAKRGHRISYLTLDRGRGLWPKCFSEIINGVEVIKLHLFRIPGRLPVTNLGSILLEKVNKRVLKKHLKRVVNLNSIEVVYSTYESLLINQLLDIPEREYKIVMRMAGMYWYEECLIKPGAIKDWERYFNQIDAVNYVTPGLAQMVKDKLKELKMKVDIQDSFCADIGTILAAANHNYTKKEGNSAFTIIMASRFSAYQKRQDVIIQAVSLVDPSIPLSVKLIGSGWEGTSISRLVEKLGVRNRINLISFMEQQQLWQEIADADLMCHACDYEGTSKIILEAMALGLPVLASNVTPLRDYINEGCNGFLVDNDPALWAKKIEQLIENEPLLTQVAQNAKNYVHRYHNPEINVQLYEDEFKKILQE